MSSACDLALSAYVPRASFFWRIIWRNHASLKWQGAMKSLHGAQRKAKSTRVSWALDRKQKNLGTSTSLPHLTWEAWRPTRMMSLKQQGSPWPSLRYLQTETLMVQCNQWAGLHINMAAIKSFFFFFFTTGSPLLWHISRQPCFKETEAHIVLFCCTLPSAVTEPWTQGHNPPSIPACFGLDQNICLTL